MSERLQQYPDTSTTKFQFRSPEEFRSGEPHCFRAAQRLNDERGLHALQSVASCCRNDFSPVNHKRSAGSPSSRLIQQTSASFGLHGRKDSSPFRGVGYQPTGWWSVRESNPRLPDYESGALTTELTVSDVAVSEPIHGTDSTKLFRVVCMPLDERHQGPITRLIR